MTGPELYAILQDEAPKVSGRWFRGLFNLNIVGIRPAKITPDAWNHRICLAWEGKDGPEALAFEATTVPGLAPEQKPTHPDGVLILEPGFHPGIWTIGKHRGAYEAYVQVRPCVFRRDAAADGIIQATTPTFSDIRGVNLHHGGDARRVGRYSEGCQVIRRRTSLARAVELGREQEAHGYGSRFSYTLLQETPALRRVLD